MRASDGGYSAWLERRARPRADADDGRCRRIACATGSAPPSTLRRRSSGRCCASSPAGRRRSTRPSSTRRSVARSSCSRPAAIRAARSSCTAAPSRRSPTISTIRRCGRELAAGLEALQPEIDGLRGADRGTAPPRPRRRSGLAVLRHVTPRRASRRRGVTADRLAADGGGGPRDLQIAADRAHPKLAHRGDRVGRR